MLCYVFIGMVRRRSGKGWFLFTQDNHAKLSAQIMSFWGGGDFFFPDPANDLLFALSEHDCGWKQADSLPVLNRNGEPEDFTEVSVPRQGEIWRRCFETHMETNVFASVLIALHFNRLNERMLSRSPTKWSLSLRREIGEFVTQALGLEDLEQIPPDTSKALRLLQIGDAISLALCHGWDSLKISDVPLGGGSRKQIKLRRVSESSYSISPWPFALRERLTFETDFTRTEKEKFRSVKRLRDDIASRSREKLSFSLSSGTSDE